MNQSSGESRFLLQETIHHQPSFDLDEGHDGRPSWQAPVLLVLKKELRLFKTSCYERKPAAPFDLTKLHYTSAHNVLGDEK